MGPISIPTLNLSKKFLSDAADASVAISSPSAPALALALRDGVGVIPAGQLVLGDIKAKASGDGTLNFGGGASKGKVTFGGHAEAGFSVGVYVDAADAIKAVSPASELAAALNLADPAATRYVVVKANYDIGATAKGSVALGTGVSGTFGVEASSAGLFAVLHRFNDVEPALTVFKDTFSSWALPSQIDSADDLKPGTWLIAEVDGSFGLQLGVQAGYDFSWIREIPGGALKGDIGLRVQLGASAAFGFDASGRYAVVIGREGNDPALRLRLFKMAKKGWNFALEGRVGIKATLPDFFNQPHKAEDLVAAIFGLNNSQLIDGLREARAFVNSTSSLQDKLAGVLMQLGGKSLEAATGLSREEIEKAFEAGRARVMELVNRFDKLLKDGGHDLTSMLLSLTGVEFDQLEEALRLIAGSGDTQKVQEIVQGLLSKAGFERLPIGRFIEAGIGPALKVIRNTEEAKRLAGLAQQGLDLLSGKTLQQVLDFIREKVHLDQVMKVVTETDFDKLDAWLKSRLADFLGKQTVLMAELTEIQTAVKTTFARVDEFYAAALAAAKKEQEFSFAATYARSTTRTALVDVSFDLNETGTVALMQAAVNGDFNDLLLQEKKGVTIAEAELTHNIKRNVTSDLTLPFGKITGSAQTISSAKLRILEDNGRVLLYSLEAESEEKQRKALFKARSGRDSTLTVAGTLPLAVNKGLKVWKDSTFQYSYKMERAVRKMRVSQFESEIGPLVTKYLPSAFSGPGARGFSEWVADLDKLLDGKDPNSGTHDIGDTLITLSLAAPPAYVRAWEKAPLNRKDVKYMDLSRALQAKLKELVTFFYFADPAQYKNLASSAPAIVFSCLPPSTTIKLNGDGKVERFDTDEDVYWDQSDSREIKAMVRSQKTLDNLRVRMNAIAGMLDGIPDLKRTAEFYTFNQGNYDDMIANALNTVGAGSSIPELLSSLLFLEQRLVANAAKTGSAMAQFRKSAGDKPAEALEHLAEFGEELADTFNRSLGGNPFLSGAARPLSTLLFMEAATTFDPTIAATGISAMMNVTVIQSNKLTLDQILDGKVTQDIILHEQPFVQA